MNKAATVIFWLPSFLTAGWKSSHLLADVTTGSIYGSGAAVPVLGLGWGVCGDFKNGFQNFQNFNKKSIVKNEFLPALYR